MSLIVENGLQITGAESYASVAFANTYFSNRNNTAWSALASDTVREGCLRAATDFMFQRYTNYWDGYRVTQTQALDWPRNYVFIRPQRTLYQLYISNTIVPIEVQKACAELALRSSTSTLMPDTKTRTKRKTVGPITIEYDLSSPQNPVYRIIDTMLSPYLNNGYGSISNEVKRA